MSSTEEIIKSPATCKAEYLQQTLDEQIKKFRERRRENRLRSVLFKLAITVFGGLTTVLIGIKVEAALSSHLQNLALVFSAAGTLFSSWDLFFNYRGMWIRYTVTVVQLLNVKSDLDYLLQGKQDDISEQEVDALYRRYQNILLETNAEWISLRKEATSKGTA